MNKKILVFAIFLISSGACLFSQESENDTAFWDFGIFFSPDFNTRTVAGSAGPGQNKAFFDEIENPRIGYSGGVTVCKQITRRLFIRSGLSLYSQGFTAPGLSDTVFNYHDSVISVSDYKLTARYQSLGIPMLLCINVAHSGNILFNIDAGLIPSLSFGRYDIKRFSSHTERSTPPSGAAFNVQAMIGLHILIPVNGHLAFVIEPCGRYDLLPQKDLSYPGISRKMLSAGLGLHLVYRWTEQEMSDYYYYKIYNKEQRPVPF